jgi:hypothetical protein
MSQSEYNDDIITWSIDRRPDYDTPSIQDTIVEETSDYVEATDYLAEYELTSQYVLDRRTREDLFLQTFHYTTNLIATRQVVFRNDDYYEYNNNDESEDFIPFGNPAGRNRVNSSPVNFIISEFYLSKEAKNCCICMEHKNYKQICKLNCHHNFCVGCINLHLNTNHYCPLCRTYITQIRTQTIEARRQIHH